MPLTETGSKSVSSIDSGESSEPWFPAKNRTSTDMAGSSALHPEAGGPWGLTQSSLDARQPQGGASGLGGRSYAESSSSSSTSSSESLDSPAPGRAHSSEFLVHGSRAQGLRMCLIPQSTKAYLRRGILLFPGLS